MAYRQSSVRSMENTAIRFGTDAAPDIIAKRKEEASREISNGNILRAKEILSDSLSLVGSSCVNDVRLSTETEQLNQTLLDSETKSSESLKKDIFYQSYKTRSSR